MRHAKAIALKTTAEKLAEIAVDARSAALSAQTGHTGLVYVENEDGTATVLGSGDATLATHVGDTTPPPVPAGISAWSGDGSVHMAWDGALEGPVPADFLRVNVLVDGAKVAELAEAGSATWKGAEAGSTVLVTATSEDDACLFDGTPAHNVSEPCAPVAVEVRDLFAEGKAEMDAVRADVDAAKGEMGEAAAAADAASKRADAAQAAADELRKTAATKTEVTRAVDEAKGEVMQSVAASYVDKATGATLATKTELSQTASSLRSEVAEAYATKESTESLASKSELEQTASSIRAEVARDYVDKATGETLATKSELEQTAEGIRLTAETALSKVDGFEVGGTNLLFATAETGRFGVSIGNCTGGITKEPVPDMRGGNGGVRVSMGASPSATWQVMTYLLGAEGASHIEPSTDYAFGFDIRPSIDFVNFKTTLMDSNGTHGVASTTDGAEAPAGKWTRVAGTFRTLADVSAASAATCLYIYMGNNFRNACTFDICNFKLEKGNVPTDWSPAPEDAEAVYATKAALAVTADSIRGEVSRDYATKASTATLAEKSYVDQRADSITSAVEQAYLKKGDAASTYAAKTEVKQTTDAIALTAQSALAKVDGLKVGGTNLLLESDTPNRKGSAAAYQAAVYPISEELEVGHQYTASAEVATAGRKALAFYVGGGQFAASPWLPLSDGAAVLSRTFTATRAMAEAQASICIFCSSTGTTQGPTPIAGTCTVRWAKLERGNVATDWSPAPEDAEATYATKAALKVETDRISGVVSEQAGLASRVSTVEQRSDGFSVSIAQAQNSADAAQSAAGGAQASANTANKMSEQVRADVDRAVNELDGVKSFTDSANAWMRFTAPGGVPTLDLGQEGGSFDMRLTNQRLAFRQGGSEVAYLSNQELYIQRARVLSALAIGDFNITVPGAGRLRIG